MNARTNTPSCRRVYAAAKTLLTVISLGAAMAATGIDAFKADLRAVRKLAELELNDYAELQIQQMQQKYPDQKDAVNLEKARIFYTIGKGADADAALKTITPQSDYFLDAILLKAEVAAARKQFADAEKAYKAYFDKVKTAPKDEDELAQFTRAVKIYSLVLKESGKGKEAAAILDKLAGVGDGDGIDERQMTFLKLAATIDAEAKKQDDRQAIDVAGLQKILTELKALQYIRDGVGASAFLQVARVQIMLGRDAAAKAMAQKKPAELAKITYFKEAIKTINTADAFLEELEGALGKTDRSKSPVAEALFYKGQAIQRQAFATALGGNKEMGRKQILAAAKYYETLIEEYPDSAFRGKAMEAHGECAKFAEQMFEEKIELAAGDGGATIDLKLEQAESLFANKNYAAAVPIYLEAVRSARLSKKLPEVVMRLAICLAQLDRLDEAEALVTYLQDVLPKEAGSAESAYRLGGVLYERARKEANPLAADDLTARAMRVWDIFIALDPSHPKAPDVAFACAEQQYKLASDLVRRAAEAKDDKNRAAIQQEALDAYRAAIPKYQRLVDVFSAFDKGVRALYKLGWIYHSLGENALGAEAFLAYYEEENDQQYLDDCLEAKFRAAELLMLGETPADAIPQFLDIAQLFATGGGAKKFNLKSATAVRIAEDAAAYLPWSYDLTAEKMRPALNGIRDQQTEAKARIKVIRDGQAARQATLEQLVKEFEAVDDDNAAMDLLVTEANLDFLSLARQQLQEKLANTAGMSEAEKKIHLQTVEQEAKKRAGDLEKQKQNTVAGELLAMDEKLTALRTSRDDAAARIETVTRRHQELQAAWQELDQRAQQLKAEVTRQRDAAAAIEKETVTVEADKQRMENAVAAATAKVNDSLDADKAKAQAELDQANNDLAEIVKKMEDVYQRKAAIITPESTKKLAADSTVLKHLDGERADLARQVRHAELLITGAKQEAELVNAKILTATRRKKLAEETAAALAKPAADRDPLLAGLRQTAANAREAQIQVSTIAEAKITSQKNAISKEAELDQLAIAEAEAEIAQLEQDLKPVKEEFDKWKQQAIQTFEAFHRAYPKSAKAPDSLSRLGTIYMEMGDHAKASAALELLARDFPDSNASKMALVNLGRAQMETGNRDAAAKSFQDLMASKADMVSVPNLSYIADAALQLDIPNAALAACREIISRGKTSHPEAGLVTGGVKDRAFVRAAEAALKLNRLTDALNFIDTLLKDNPKTAFFFDAKFLQAQARVKNNPPDLDGAVAALQEILQYADNQTVSNRALCELGEILAKSGDPVKKQQAVARFHLVAMFGDIATEANRDYVERAIVGSARILAENNDQEDLKIMIDKYKKDFPNGKFSAELNKLAR